MAYSLNTTLDRHKKINDSFSCTNMEKFQGGKKQEAKYTVYTHYVTFCKLYTTKGKKQDNICICLYVQ